MYTVTIGTKNPNEGCNEKPTSNYNNETMLQYLMHKTQAISKAELTEMKNCF
jgi:hypothetical protein